MRTNKSGQTAAACNNTIDVKIRVITLSHLVESNYHCSSSSPAASSNMSQPSLYRTELNGTMRDYLMRRLLMIVTTAVDGIFIRVGCTWADQGHYSSYCVPPSNLVVCPCPNVHPSSVRDTSLCCWIMEVTFLDDNLILK